MTLIQIDSFENITLITFKDLDVLSIPKDIPKGFTNTNDIQWKSSYQDRHS